jgi:hypothetical protein
MTAWTAEWPRCLLLLELATRYAESGRPHGCAKLQERLEEWRGRMDSAPPTVHMLLSELRYFCWLLGRGDLAAAWHHLAEARKKAEKISRRLGRWQREEVCRQASSMRQQSWRLRRRSRDLRERSGLLLAQAALLRRFPSPQAATELVLG